MSDDIQICLPSTSPKTKFLQNKLYELHCMITYNMLCTILYTTCILLNLHLLPILISECVLCPALSEENHHTANTLLQYTLIPDKDKICVYIF